MLLQRQGPAQVSGDRRLGAVSFCPVGTEEQQYFRLRRGGNRQGKRTCNTFATASRA
jgi:hypothetical protein